MEHLSRSLERRSRARELVFLSRTSSKIINRMVGTRYVNEALVKAKTSRFFFCARTPAADVSRPSGHLPPPARPTSRSGTFLLRMRSTKYPEPWLDFCTDQTDISFRSWFLRTVQRQNAKLTFLEKFKLIYFDSIESFKTDKKKFELLVFFFFFLF